MKPPIIIFLALLLILPVISAAPITSCSRIFAGNHILQNDVTSPYGCFLILGYGDIDLDCQGHTISYNSGGFDNSRAIDIRNADNVTIRNCDIRDVNPLGVRGFGIYTENSNDISLISNSIHTDSTANGFGIVSASTNKLYVANNNIDTSSSGQGLANIGIIMAGVSGVIIENNNVQSGGIQESHGVSVGFSDDVRIIDNTINTRSSQTAADGIRLAFMTNNSVVEDNLVTTDGNSEDHGINIFLESSRNLVQNNVIETKSDFSNGIVVDNSSNNDVLNNEIKVSGQYSYGIYAERGTNRILNNKIESSGGEWLYLGSQAQANLYGTIFKSSEASVELLPRLIIQGPIQAESNDIQLSHNFVLVNTSKIPQFNTNANIEFKGLSFVSPKVTADWNFDGIFQDCDPTICTITSYTGGDLYFSVNSVASFSSEENLTPLVCGDCNENGQVDILDALIAAREAAALPTGITATGRMQCDVITDGFVNILDALTIARYSSGIIPSLTC